MRLQQDYDYFLIVLVIVTIILGIYIFSNRVPLLGIKNNKPLKYCLLLTTFIKNRESLYTTKVIRWLNETNLDIYLVDSSNQGLPLQHSRLHQFKFQQSDPFVDHNPSVYEINSILKAIDYFDFSHYDMIIKVTGKYFIPKLEKALNYIPSDADIVLQNRTYFLTQNTELLVIKQSLIKEILNKYTERTNFEKFMYKLNGYKFYRFHPFPLDSLVSRSDGSILKHL